MFFYILDVLRTTVGKCGKCLFMTDVICAKAIDYVRLFFNVACCVRFIQVLTIRVHNGAAL